MAKRRQQRVRRGGRPRAGIIGDALRLLSQMDRPRTVVELARGSGLHPQTVYRLLRALPDAGISIRDEVTPRQDRAGSPTRRYFVDPTDFVRAWVAQVKVPDPEAIMSAIEREASSLGFEPPEVGGDVQSPPSVEARHIRLQEWLDQKDCGPGSGMSPEDAARFAKLSVGLVQLDMLSHRLAEPTPLPVSQDRLAEPTPPPVSQERFDRALVGLVGGLVFVEGMRIAREILDFEQAKNLASRLSKAVEGHLHDVRMGKRLNLGGTSWMT